MFEAPAPALSQGRGFDVVGGMQVHTARLTAALAERGVDQTVVTAYRPGAPRIERLAEGTQVLRVGWKTKAFRQWYGVAAIPALSEASRDVDLIHAHLGEDLAVLPLAARAAARAGAPIAITVHCSLRFTLRPNGPRATVLRMLGGALERRVESAAGAIFVLTSRMAELLERSGLERSRIHVIPAGIDLASFRRVQARPPELGYGRRIVYAGRLVAEKGVRELVEAMSLIRATDAGLLLVGDGPERAGLEASAARLGIADRVRFAGLVPNHRIPAILQHADLLVLPSWYEELGRVLVEGMAADVPIVATNVGGIPSLVRDGVNGFLVPPRDPAALAGAFDDVLDHPEIAASLSAEGRRVAERHDVSALADRTLETYAAIVGVTREAADARLGVA